jgi:hypothetical protein
MTTQELMNHLAEVVGETVEGMTFNSKGPTQKDQREQRWFERPLTQPLLVPQQSRRLRRIAKLQALRGQIVFFAAPGTELSKWHSGKLLGVICNDKNGDRAIIGTGLFPDDREVPLEGVKFLSFREYKACCKEQAVQALQAKASELFKARKQLDDADRRVRAELARLLRKA